jgi:hypothetical protein
MGKSMPLLQAGVFKHPMVGKRRLEGDGHQKNDCEGGMREGSGHYQEGHWGWAPSHPCLSLALFLEVAMFALFQYFSVFQSKGLNKHLQNISSSSHTIHILLSNLWNFSKIDSILEHKATVNK